MTITPQVQRQFFDESSNRVIYLPSRQSSSSMMVETLACMSDMLDHSSQPWQAADSSDEWLPAFTVPFGHESPVSDSSASRPGSAWSEEEHARFLLGLDLFPTGPWKQIAGCVGTRTARQTMSHAQKYRQKIRRRQRGLRPSFHRRPHHSVITDDNNIQRDSRGDARVWSTVATSADDAELVAAVSGAIPPGQLATVERNERLDLDEFARLSLEMEPWLVPDEALAVLLGVVPTRAA